jgi:hypothetical protein
MPAGFYVFPRCSKAEVNYMQNFLVVSEPEFPVLSNGELFLALSLILCSGNG